VTAAPSRAPAFLRNGRALRKNAGLLAAAGLAATAAVVASTRQRWRAAEDPCATTALDIEAATSFKVERPDGAVLDGVVVGPHDGPPGGMGGVPLTTAAGAATGTVVLSHCWTGSRATWEPVAARLVAAGQRVVLYDQRGHGASTVGRDAPTVEQLGEDLAAVLEAVDARGAVLAGHSMGGMTLQALAIARPDVVAERVKALVLVGTAGFGVAAGPLSATARFVTGNRGVERLMASRLGPALTRGTVGRSPRQGHLVATRDAFLSLPTDVRRQFLIALQAMDFRAGLASVAVPTTVVIGSRDLLTPPRLSRALAAAIPGAHLVEVPGAGHMLPYEEPDRLAEIILSAGTHPKGGPS
jgi:non-heme chloroperoxidase